MNASDLGAGLSRLADGARLIVVSNREPLLHELTAEGIQALRPASGMVTAIEPIVRSIGGTWIAHGAGSADRLVVDERDRVGLPLGDPRYTLRRLWLDRQEEEGYYYGLANNALWPLCHVVYRRPHFSRQDWETYCRVNRRFCDAVLDEAEGQAALVFIQDYHLALLARMIKDARPDLTVMQFWHIPWPNREAFRVFPWGEQMLDGLLGNDLLGFQVQYHCNNFLDTVDRGIEARVDYEHFRIFRRAHPTYVRPFPISVDCEQIGRDAALPPVESRMASLCRRIQDADGDQKLFVGADRIDYTKGIPERLRALDLMLRLHPEWKAKVAYLQLAAPSRTHLESYRRLNEEIDTLVDEINWRHQTESWTPVHFLRGHHEYHSVLAAYRLAHVLLVTSLHDGMNLVAKEFISARTDGDGLLILSPYTGAARELPDAMQVNPYDIDRLAEVMHESCQMTEQERRQRMSHLRLVVQSNNVYHWGARIFEELARTSALG